MTRLETPRDVDWLVLADARAVVRTPDGRTGRLIFAAPFGSTCRVLLPSGSYVNFRKAQLTPVLEEDADG